LKPQPNVSISSNTQVERGRVCWSEVTGI
jgi:hypothetical protein